MLNPTNHKEPNMPRTARPARQAKKFNCNCDAPHATAAECKAYKAELAGPYQGRTAADVPGLSGAALQAYLETGQRLTTQVKIAQGQRAVAEAAAQEAADKKEVAKATRRAHNRKNRKSNKSTPKSTPNTEEATMARTRKDQPAKQSTRTEARKAEGTPAAQVAKQHNLDARRFRAFLRANDISRTFATKGEATKAVRAFTKSLA